MEMKRWLQLEVEMEVEVEVEVPMTTFQTLEAAPAVNPERTARIERTEVVKRTIIAVNTIVEHSATEP